MEKKILVAGVSEKSEKSFGNGKNISNENMKIIAVIEILSK